MTQSGNRLGLFLLSATLLAWACILTGCAAASIQPETSEERLLAGYKDLGDVVDLIAELKRNDVIDGNLRDVLLASAESAKAGLDEVYTGLEARRRAAAEQGNQPSPLSPVADERLDAVELILQGISAALTKASDAQGG